MVLTFDKPVMPDDALPRMSPRRSGWKQLAA